MNLTLLEDAGERSVYLPVAARIAAVDRISQLEKLFTIELPGALSLNHAPGQFIELSVFGIALQYFFFAKP
jgi:NAD(P)H-flavin reductase